VRCLLISYRSIRRTENVHPTFVASSSGNCSGCVGRADWSRRDASTSLPSDVPSGRSPRSAAPSAANRAPRLWTAARSVTVRPLPWSPASGSALADSRTLIRCNTERSRESDCNRGIRPFVARQSASSAAVVVSIARVRSSQRRWLPAGACAGRALPRPCFSGRRSLRPIRAFSARSLD